MSKGNQTEQDVLAMVFQQADPAWRLADNNVYVCLHTGDPGEAGTQLTSECAYPGYLRQVVPKTALGWDLTSVGGASKALNHSQIQFPICGGVFAETAKYASIGTVPLPGAGQILYSGQLTADLNISNLIQPQFGVNMVVISED